MNVVCVWVWVLWGLVGGLAEFRFTGLGCCVYLVLRGICFVVLCCFELCLLPCCWWFYVMFGVSCAAELFLDVCVICSWFVCGFSWFCCYR